MPPSMPILLLVALPNCKLQYFNKQHFFFWDFDNGSTSTLNNPSATFINPGFYTIKLVANGATGSDSIISIDYIQVLDKPSASFSYNILSNCENDNFIDFTNTSVGYTSIFGILVTIQPIQLIQLTLIKILEIIQLHLVVYNNFGCSDDSTIGPLVIYPTPILNAVTIQILLVIVLIISLFLEVHLILLFLNGNGF